VGPGAADDDGAGVRHDRGHGFLLWVKARALLAPVTLQC
jgi:hypothetical protein